MNKILAAFCFSVTLFCFVGTLSAIYNENKTGMIINGFLSSVNLFLGFINMWSDK